MKPILLITGALPLNDERRLAIKNFGYDLVEMPDEGQALPPLARKATVVVCNQLFLHQSLDNFPELRLIHLTSAGVDRLPIDEIRHRGIAVRTAGDTYSVPMAEWVLTKILDHYKRTAVFLQRQGQRRWEKQRDLQELAGKRACLIGAGHAGLAIAKRLSAFDVSIDIFSRTTRSRPHVKRVHTYSAIDQFLPDAHMLIVAAPLSAETKNLINRDRISMLRPDCFVINVARGELVDEVALVRALESNRIGGAALDVFQEEPLHSDDPLWTLPSTYISPHNSYVSDKIGERLFSKILSNLRAFLAETPCKAGKEIRS